LSGALHLGAGYDDSLLQDASAVGGAVSEDAFDLNYRGRAWRDLSSVFDLHSALLIQPNAPSQDLSDSSLDGRLAWRFFDVVSPVLEASGRLLDGPHSSVFNATELNYAGGLHFDLWALGSLEALGQGGQSSYPNTDLDSTDKGGELRLDLDLGEGLRRKGWLHSAERDYSERKDYLNKNASQGPDFRTDQILDWQSSLAWAQDDLGTLALIRGQRLSSNGDSIDFGPGQDQYNDVPAVVVPGLPPTFISDNTLIKDYFSHESLGGGLVAWALWDGWRLQGQASVDETHYSGRIAKGSDDKFLAGSPLREDRLIQGALSLSYHWALGSQSWDLALNWQHWQSSSNDFINQYQRNLSQLVLGLLF
jgi:hypothetical protein